jgi:L-ribulose-5-phosphate 4-epimerase
MADEGIVKFEAQHRSEALDPMRYGDLASKLIAWREVLAKMQLVGEDPVRYGGAGYGNVSGRIGPAGAVLGKRAMMITGTQTSGLANIGLSHLCVVDEYDYRQNRVRSQGVAQPSSETMTHGAIYDLSPAIRFVFHAHSPIIWQRSRSLRIPTTDHRVAYGTPQMALDVQRLFSGSTLSATRILSMGGHEDGVIVFGHTAEEAGQVLVTYLARAYEQTCKRIIPQ